MYNSIVSLYFIYFPLAQILYAKDADQRSQTFEKSLAMGEEYQRRTTQLILRSAMLKNNICVKVSGAISF